MHKPVLGLWIIPDYEAEKPRFKGDDRLCYKTRIGKFEKNREGMFVTNPAFRQWIQENAKWIGKHLGSIELVVREKEKKIKLNWFYPFGEAKRTGKKKWRYPQDLFGGKGIGAFAFFRVLKEAQRMFPAFQVRLGTTPTPEMRGLMKRIGWKKPYQYKLSTGTKRARRYVAEQMRRHRKK